jgi:lysophospholipase L1-like esterase
VRLALVIGSAVFATAVIEIALRLFGLGFNHAPMVSDAVLHHSHPRNYAFRAYHPSGEYGGHLVHFDADGYRVDPMTPPGSGIRIAVVGDSFVEALQVDYGASLAGRLQELTADAAVRNFGVSSYSPLLYVLQWRRDIERFAPDIVVLVLFSNDVADDESYAQMAVRSPAGETTAVPGPADNALRNALRRSHLARLGAVVWNRLEWQWTHRGDDTVAVPNDSPFLEERPTLTPLTSSELRRFVDAVRQRGARVLLTTVPSRAAVVANRPADDVFATAVNSWAREHSVPYADLAAAFVRSGSAAALYFANDIHWTSAGHRVAAEAICRAINELGARCDVPQ